MVDRVVCGISFSLAVVSSSFSDSFAVVVTRLSAELVVFSGVPAAVKASVVVVDAVVVISMTTLSSLFPTSVALIPYGAH